MELHDYARLLRRIWIVVVVLVIAGAATGWTIDSLRAPRYESTAKAFVAVKSASSLADLTSGAAYTQQAAASYADIATTAYVLRPVITQLHLRRTTADLATSVTVTAGDQAAVLQITVQDASATQAAGIANAITSQLASAVVALTPDGASTSTVKLTPVDPAVAPVRPLGPGAPLFVAGGAAGGLVLAFVIGLLLDLLDTRIRSQQDLVQISDVTLLGSTLRDNAIARRPLVVRDYPASPRAEAYRSIRTNLRFVELDAAARSIVVTSSLEGEGKSTTAANLAIAVAGLGERVLLVDADLRRPRVADLFGLDGGTGLTDVLIGEVSLGDATQSSDISGLDLLPAGTVPPNPNEQLQSRAMTALIGRLHEQYDLVIFDSPPLLAVSDAAVLSTLTGGAIVVGAAGRLRRAQLTQALAMLDQAGVRVFGLVLTMVTRRVSAAYGYGYGVVTASGTASRSAPGRAARKTSRSAPLEPLASAETSQGWSI